MIVDIIIALVLFFFVVLPLLFFVVLPLFVAGAAKIAAWRENARERQLRIAGYRTYCQQRIFCNNCGTPIPPNRVICPQCEKRRAIP